MCVFSCVRVCVYVCVCVWVCEFVFVCVCGMASKIYAPCSPMLLIQVINLDFQGFLQYLYRQYEDCKNISMFWLYSLVWIKLGNL